MFAKQLKDNEKGLFIWGSLFLILLSAVFCIYPSIMAESKDTINQLLAVFPQELLDAFNMTDIATPSGWVNSEGMIFFLLGGAVYSALLGSNCVWRERKDGTIEFLAVKPVRRTSIIVKKALADLLSIFLFTLVASATILIGLLISDDLDAPVMLAVTLSPLLVFAVLYALCLFLSICFQGSVGLALGVSIGFYIPVVLSKLSESMKFFRYCTPFTLSDTVSILADGHLDIECCAMGILLFIILFGGSIWLYNRREAL
ncbi:MAG: ABC transporter permease subunit [Clostridiales bacterium]|nr:ABC transporter permease subunit [Clostridiales bacterium]